MNSPLLEILEKALEPIRQHPYIADVVGDKMVFGVGTDPEVIQVRRGTGESPAVAVMVNGANVLLWATSDTTWVDVGLGVWVRSAKRSVADLLDLAWAMAEAGSNMHEATDWVRWRGSRLVYCVRYTGQQALEKSRDGEWMLVWKGVIRLSVNRRDLQRKGRK